MEISVYSSYDLEEVESEIKPSKIGTITLSKMMFKIENKEITSLPPKAPPRAQQQTYNSDLLLIPLPIISLIRMMNSRIMYFLTFLLCFLK